MSNQKKQSILNMISFTKNVSLVTDDLNDFFDESFVDYLINESSMLRGQLTIALSCFKYDQVFINEHLTSRDKKLIAFLLKYSVNISDVINSFSESCYNEFKQYIKQLYELRYIDDINIIYTNNIDIIKDVIGNSCLDFINLINCLRSESVSIDIKKYILSISDNRETFINKSNVCVFYYIINELNLDDSFKNERITKLESSLNNSNTSVVDLKEIISELICQDSYHNFMLNLELVSNYYDSEVNISQLLKELSQSLLYVKNILEKDTIDKEQIDFLFSNYGLIGKRFKETIMLIRSNFNYNLNEKLQSDEIYLVHTTFISDLTKNDDIKKNYNKHILHESRRLSFSLLNKNKTGTYGRKNDTIIFGYNSSPNNNLLSATLGDARTAQSRIWTRSSFLSIDDYLANTVSSHNELLYCDIDKVIEPDYILSFHEEATELEQRVASLFDIPIKYLCENNYNNDESIIYSDKSYIFDDSKEKQ